ncbi:MAG: GTP-binding protein [Canidatus Methanoxibalbensis ujae]|nr:GTP-binding protein [Candidatus Methanoxibalbensis ujae]
MSITAEIRRIEEELRNTPYNKATEHHIGRLKAKLARLRGELEKERSRRSGGGAAPFRKAGDATVVLVGFPSVGKSTLLNSLTNACSAVAEYDFTTISVVPGMLKYKSAEIQVLDVPGIVEGASSGRGRGREVLSVIRNADLIIIVTDVLRCDVQKIIEELRNAGIRINESPPAVKIVKKAKGGISIYADEIQIEEKTLHAILKEYKIHNADVFIREKNITIERFIDAIEGNRRYVPAIIAVNKIDMLDDGGADGITRIIERIKGVDKSSILPISAEKGTNIEMLKDMIYEKMRFIRVFLRPPGKQVEKEPMVLREGAKVGDVCDKIHGNMRSRFKYARVWGKSVKYDGQRVGAEHELCDGDTVSIFVR